MRERKRREDIEDVLGYLPMPDLDGADYLVTVLFRIGPSVGEKPISEQDICFWEQRRGIELAPWQADAIVDMSRAYMSESYAAEKMSAPPPWPKAVKMWKYVTDKINTPPTRKLKES